MSLTFKFTLLFLFTFNFINAQNELIKLTETKITWRERTGAQKIISVNYKYDFQIGNGPTQRIGKNASNLEKYITARVARRQFDKCIKQTKTANTGAVLSFVGGGIMAVGAIWGLRADPLTGEGPGLFNGFTIAGVATAAIGLSLRSIYQKKARASLKKSVGYQNKSNLNSGLFLDLQHSNVAYNIETKSPQLSLNFIF